MSNRRLTEQFDTWRSCEADLVLATVIETAGSTYSKTGRQLLITRDHRYAGLVGGGCLEGDLVLRADEVFADGSPQIVTYDLRDDADELWGMGLGCRGMMRLLLQRVSATEDWQPFAAIAARMCGTESVEVALALGDARHRQGELLDPAATSDAVRWTIHPWPRLLVLGAGPDAGPVAELAATLGWHITVGDHRPDLLTAEYLNAADERLAVDPAAVDRQLQLDQYSAVCVMSHHLHSDCEYLRALSRYSHTYIGVLGPAARRAELLERLGLQGTAFANRLRGPVGLNIGADTPQSIALALLAEIHASLRGADE